MKGSPSSSRLNAPRRQPGMRLALVFSALVAVVCLVALTSGSVLCKLDSGRCKSFGDRGAGPAPSPLTQRGSGALRPHAASFHATVQAKCAERGPFIPRVAFLFMTRGNIWHEAMWKAWFRSAVGLVPADIVRGHNCSASIYSRIASACIPDQNPQNILGSQHLFSVYIHIPPGETGHPEGNIFHGHEIPVHIQASWGGFELVDIAKELYKAALLDKANQKMVLLSESCLPLYPPTLLYAQLISEPKSRINGCHDWGNMPWRWHPKMATVQSAQITPALWRKSSQWSVLHRDLAAVVANDTLVADLFRESCVEKEWDSELDRHYECYADEHYVPTLLAYKGLEAQTDCLGYTTSVDWSEGKPHPRTYTPEDVTAATVKRLRGTIREAEPCYSSAALRLVKYMFVEAGGLQSTAHCQDEAPWAPALLGRTCPLFARKFPENTTAEVHKLYTDCDAKLGIARGCKDEEPWARR